MFLDTVGAGFIEGGDVIEVVGDDFGGEGFEGDGGFFDVEV